jgi:prephenate dehydrogenase
MSALAAGGFRDSTRLASGDVSVHRDIVMTNRSALVRWLDAAIERLVEIRDADPTGR